MIAAGAISTEGLRLEGQLPARSGRLSNRPSDSSSFLDSCFLDPTISQRPYVALYSRLWPSASHRLVLKVTNHQEGGITW